MVQKGNEYLEHRVGRNQCAQKRRADWKYGQGYINFIKTKKGSTSCAMHFKSREAKRVDKQRQEVDELFRVT